MAEDSEEPAISLGEGNAVEGAPVARVAERLTWGIEKSAIEEREGETVIRTPDGPQQLAAVLENVERTYFSKRQEFENAVRAVIGRGPIPVAESEDSGGVESEGESEGSEIEDEGSDDSDTDEGEGTDEPADETEPTE